MTQLPEEGADKPSADAFGRSLGPGLGINLLVEDIARSLRFHVKVLGASVQYWDRNFAIVEALGSVWQLHQDDTYHSHPLRGIVKAADARGVGAELRLYGRDPDEAILAANEIGSVVLADAADKPHGLRAQLEKS